jgi:hypothetical protein
MSKSKSMSPFAALLKRHIQQNPYSGYVTMATVENSRPRARTVLFQGLAEESDGSLGICIKTHKGSSKVTKADSAAVELVWWMEQSSVQWRLQGDIDYSNEAQRLRVWDSLNPAAKSQFFYDAHAGLDTSTSGCVCVCVCVCGCISVCENSSTDMCVCVCIDTD